MPEPTPVPQRNQIGYLPVDQRAQGRLYKVKECGSIVRCWHMDCALTAYFTGVNCANPRDNGRIYLAYGWDKVVPHSGNEEVDE